MIASKKTISIFISLIMLFTVFHVNAPQANQGNDKTITNHEPQSRVSDEIKLSGGHGSKWLWILLGAAVVIGGIAAIAPGSEDSDQTYDTSEPDTGSVSGSW